MKSHEEITKIVEDTISLTAPFEKAQMKFIRNKEGVLEFLQNIEAPKNSNDYWNTFNGLNQEKQTEIIEAVNQLIQTKAEVVSEFVSNFIF